MPRPRLLIASLALLAHATAAAAQPGQTGGEPAPAPAPAPTADPYGPAPQPHPYPPPHPQPYPYYPPPYYPPPPPPPSEPPPEPTGEMELMGTFAGLGLLSSILLLDARDWDDPSSGTLIVIAGGLGGAGIGYIIADRGNVTRSHAQASQLGLTIGLANAGLMLVPLRLTDSSEEVLGALLVGGTAGALGGLALGKGMDLTRGQTMFVGNLSLLGFGTAVVVGALIDDDNGELDPSETLALAIGLDGGLAAGLVFAPKIDWSYGRAKFVSAASLVGTFLGAMIGGVLASERLDDGTRRTDPDIAAASILVGMWGGFAGGVMLSSDWTPDARFRTAGAAPITAAPMIGGDAIGIVARGSF